MERAALLALYDEQVRRRTTPDEEGVTVEADAHVVRRIAPPGAWGGITYSALDDADVDSVIAAQLRRFAATEGHWEWKHYSHDRPADLPRRLTAAGLQAGEPEALLVLDLDDGAGASPAPAPPPGIRLAPVRDTQDGRALVTVYDDVFGGENTTLVETLLASIGNEPPSAVGVLAFADDEPVAAGRLELPPASAFAGMWGGATRAPWRRRGIYRALVAWRVALARERGYRYVHVDAAAMSEPILRGMGFVQLAVTTPFTPRADAA